MYAIIGKNIRCVQTVFDMFINKQNVNNITMFKCYFNFAAVYGTLEIIQYMITRKPHFVDQIENFYDNLLKFALCEGNIEIVKFAINNGATYNHNMKIFVEDYNNNRNDDYIGVENDDFDMYELKRLLPEDINDRIEECMRFINN
jgi:hypothetical protein